MSRLLGDRITGFVRDVDKAISVEDPYALVLRLTLLLLLLLATGFPLVDVPVRVACGTMLLFPPLLRAAAIWWALVFFQFIKVLAQWHVLDNHEYLAAYWVVTCAISLHLADRFRDTYVRWTARVLIGLVFVCATVWKLLAAEYLDGRFLYYTALLDPRLETISSFLTTHGLEDLRLGREAVRAMGSLGLEDARVPLASSGRLWFVAIGLSWLTIVGEGTIAALHLWPPRRYQHTRHYALMGFVGATYFFLPVVGFAFVLAILGFAQCDRGDQELRADYLLLLLIVQLTAIPWQRLVGGYS